MNEISNYLERLNDKQREAALHTEGPLLVLAGAGSGKTSTMTCRIAHLIEEGVSPYNILAVTFTNKAAKEMRDRVESLMSEINIQGGYIPDVSSMWIHTFHSACLRILRVNADRLGYSNDFTIYDPQDQKTLVKGIIKEKRIDEKKFTPAYVLSIISDCKNKSESPESFLSQNINDYKTKIIHEIYSAYEEKLKKNNAMDFDDLLLNTVKVFEKNEDVLVKYQNRFRYIMVDEYQDTNYIQYKFVSMLAEAHNNICVVGDDDQCIYEWRGADIRNILDFERDFKNTKVIKLEQNYRSYGNILDIAHSVISHNMGRKDKRLWTSKEAGEKITYRRADDEKDEARYIAQEVSHMVGSDLGYGDIAVLYRTNAQSRVFEEAFSSMNVPYRVLGGLRYYDRKEIKDIIAYMRLVQNSDDDLSLARVINEPKRGMGDKTMEKIAHIANLNGTSLFEVFKDHAILNGLPPKASKSVGEMVAAISEYSAEKDNLKVSDIYDGILVRTGYLKALEDQNTIEAESRIENILEFKSVIMEYEKDDPNLTLADFMERIALMADVDNHNPDENAVVLMTLHSAKGLEFPVVFMPGMEEGLFPGWRAMDRPDGIEEERRLCYVGMTRAKKKLFLTSAATRTMYGRTDYTRESQFLRELDRKLIIGDAIFETRRLATPDGGPKWELDGGYVPEYKEKPFNSLKYAKQEIKKTTAEIIKADYEVGDRVVHTKFGEGLVIEMEEKTVSVMFDEHGRKKLAKDLAPLRKL